MEKVKSWHGVNCWCSEGWQLQYFPDTDGIIDLINPFCYPQPQRLETAANVAKSAYADWHISPRRRTLQC